MISKNMEVDNSFAKVEYPSLDVGQEENIPLDFLDRTTFANNIAELLKSGNLKTPYVFGLYGEWGAGKSWVMSSLNKNLKHAGYPTCWFEAWRYENDASLLYPICRNIE